jgi:hypothetical protein
MLPLPHTGCGEEYVECALSDQIVTASGLTKGCDAATYCVQETLHDGSGVLIRAIRYDDRIGYVNMLAA